MLLNFNLSFIWSKSLNNIKHTLKERMQLRYNDTEDAFEISVPQKMAVFIGLVLESLVGIGKLIKTLLCIG